VNPWWLRPPADEDEPKGSRPERPAKSEETAKPVKTAKPKKAAQPRRSGGSPAQSSADRSAISAEGKPEQKSEEGQRRSGRKRSSSRRRKPAAKGARPLALLCDAESIAMAMQSANVEDLDLKLVLDQLGRRGQVVHKKAYGDWHRLSELEDDFRSAGVDVIDLPPAEHSGGTSVSMPLALDAMELCYSSQAPDIFVLFSAETDLTPLVEKLKAARKQVLGLGIHDAVLPVLAEACDEFLFYNEFSPSEPETQIPEETDETRSPLFTALVEIIDSLGEEGSEVIWGAKLKREMRNRQPDLDLGSLGFATFSEFLEDADRHQIIRLERDDRSGSYYVAATPRQ
jgi:uncharacterized LabA/DUF88 family protein